MTPREPHIPLFLWVATAALAHILWGGGADKIAGVFEDQTAFARLAASVRAHVSANNQPFEVTLFDPAQDEAALSQNDSEQVGPTPEAEPAEELPKPTEDDPRASQPSDQAPDVEPSPEPEVKPAERTPEQTPPKPEAEPLPVDKPKELPKANIGRRVSVQQHVQDKNQEDNPDALYQADEANRVAEDVQSRLTSTDENDANPTPGQTHLGPSPVAGDAPVTDIAQSESSPGDPDEAPTTSQEDGSDDAEQAKSDTEAPRDPVQAVYGEPARPASAGGVTPENVPSPPQPKASPGQKAVAEVEAREAVAEVANAADSEQSVASAQEAQSAQAARRARAARPKPKPSGGSGPAFGQLGLTPNGLNPNLTPLAALNAVGAEQLQRERIADGERRRSTHRGSWQAVGLERWRSAIENYVPTARPGNNTALNTARVPFASYLNRIHNRLHPVFAERFLSSLDGLPQSHPANRHDLSTNLEIVLSPEDGRIVRMGVTKASGTTVFDVNALEAVQKASPFGAAPDAVISPDGHVYLHWEFHRDPKYACSTYFARPLMLRVAPKTAPPNIPFRQPATPQEHGSNRKLQPKTGSGG